MWQVLVSRSSDHCGLTVRQTDCSPFIKSSKCYPKHLGFILCKIKIFQQGNYPGKCIF